MPHDYRVRRSDRARRVRVVVHPDRAVEVVLPRRAAETAAAAAVLELDGWITKQLSRIDELLAQAARPEGTVPWLGSELVLVPEPERRRVHRKGGALLVPASDPWPAIERWYRGRARAEIEPRLDACVARAGTTYTRLDIRNQRTRWGSCSARGVISINWRLLLAPAEVLDYVIEHEVCHLERHDHSPAFWALLEARMPGWREHAAWLRRYGPTLTLRPAGAPSA